MATPTAPTRDTIITEAFARCGIASPTSDQLLRAQTQWFEEVKTELSEAKTWHSCEETMVVIPQAYLQVYAMPSPLVRVLRMRFYRGSKTGIATDGGTNTISVAAGTGDANDRGRKIFLVSGTGVAQVGRITVVSGDDYTISCDWDVAPIAGTGYMIADTEHLIAGPTPNVAMHGISPSTTIEHWDFIEHNLRFWPALDDAGQYAMEIDGEVDLALVDSDDARMTRLLREWRNPILKGLMARIKEDQDDYEGSIRDEQRFEKSKLGAMKKDVRKRQQAESPGFRSIGGTVRKH